MYIEDVEVGQRLVDVEHRPGSVQLFRFSAATWNAHRIHYDDEYARLEGYPGILVQSHLQGCFLAHAAVAWTNGLGTLRKFRWENRRFAVADDILVCSGVVVAVRQEGRTGLVDLELAERGPGDELYAPAWATVEVPSRRPPNWRPS
jgi:acyl dehydratase